MAGRYVEGVADPETIRLAAASLAQELIRSLVETSPDAMSRTESDPGANG
jgi:hypothetical protein